MAERDVRGEVAVRAEDVEEVDATQRYVPVPEVHKDLENRIWSLGLVEQTLPELNAAARITREFLLGAGVVDDDDEALWSERRAQQATRAIADLIRTNYNMRKLQPQYSFRPVEVPLRKPMPSDVGNKWEEFIKRRWYAGWNRSIQPVANFDAKSTEWTLVNMFDSSASVAWWLRIYEPGEVWIERDTGGKYYPDFIVLDTQNVYWVVEGKADRDARAVDVLDKKRTAEEWTRFVRDDGRFGIWRYVFATEAHIKQAKSWQELLARTKPER
jgi:type III restriction enzyme